MKRLILLLPFLAVMCGGAESKTDTTNGAAPEETTAAASSAESAAPTAGPADFTAADLDLYERGLTQEIALVKAARERGANAATPAERGAAAQQEWEDHTIPAAAKAASIDEARYRRTREAVNHVFETLDFQGKIDGPLEMDLTRVTDPAAKERLAQDPFTTLTPGAAAALRARMDKLLPVWIDYMKLTALHG
ncbi:MAG TPA: hypothetical protein VF618_06475 [Thermoanaerobaculia bacterium]